VYDRAGRDRYRHPMQWDASPSGGFTTGDAWLPAVDPAQTNVEAQREDPRSTLSLVRDLLALRRVLGEGLELVEAPPGVLAYRRDDHLIAINTTGEDSRIPVLGEAVIETTPGAFRDRTLAAHSGVITRSDEGVGHH
jgi:glycosidase